MYNFVWFIITVFFENIGKFTWIPVLLMLYYFVDDRKQLDLEKLNINEKIVYQKFYNIARKNVNQKYVRLKKPRKTLSGKYRMSFLDDISKESDRLFSKCCKNDHFSPDFCHFVRENKIVVTKGNLQTIINHYLFSMEQKKEHYSTDEFLDMAEFQQMRESMEDFVGVYILYNETRRMYYVGQAKRVLFRLNQHFTGHGNGDVYADYKFGDVFKVKMIRLTDSGYSNLDALEKDMIADYHAYENGYNRTQGNG